MAASTGALPAGVRVVCWAVCWAAALAVAKMAAMRDLPVARFDRGGLEGHLCSGFGRLGECHEQFRFRAPENTALVDLEAAAAPGAAAAVGPGAATPVLGLRGAAVRVTGRGSTAAGKAAVVKAAATGLMRQRKSTRYIARVEAEAVAGGS